MAQIALNSAAAILIAAAFLATAAMALRTESQARIRVPAKVRNRHHPNG
ncbi:hypothetical protein [Rhizobium sp. AN80A]|nr:hypothetical protein [Rhizobium sp. AN80A]